MRAIILLSLGAAFFIAAAWNAQAVISAYVDFYSGPNAYRIPQIIWGAVGGTCLLVALCLIARPRKTEADETDEAGA